MFRTFYPAAKYETPLSLLCTLAFTTMDKTIVRLVSEAQHSNSLQVQIAPCTLSRFCRLTDDFYGNSYQVLMQRTIFPLYLSCMTEPQATCLANKVIYGLRKISGGLNLPMTNRSANRFGIQCRECNRLSISETGRRCSLSFHCIPLQSRCPLHGCRYSSANARCELEILTYTTETPAKKHNSEELSTTLFRLIETSIALHSVKEMMSTLYARGYIEESGQVRTIELAQDFASHYSHGFDDRRLNELIARGTVVFHALNCIKQPTLYPHPIEIALLNTALRNIEYTSPHTNRS